MRFIEKKTRLNGMVCSIYCVSDKVHYLSMRENYIGLRVFFKNEIDIVSNDEIEMVEFKNIVTQKNDKMHPVLLQILKDDWDLYIDIVEGVPDAWSLFMQKVSEFNFYIN